MRADKAEKRFSKHICANPADKSSELGNAATLESHAWVNQFNVKTRAGRRPAHAVAPHRVSFPSSLDPFLVPRERYTRHADALRARAHSTSIHRAFRHDRNFKDGKDRRLRSAL